TAYWNTVRPQESFELFSEALDGLDEDDPDDQPILAMVMNDRAWALAYLGRIDEAVQQAKRSLELSRPFHAEHPWLAFDPMNVMLSVSRLNGDFASARAYAREGIRLVKEVEGEWYFDLFDAGFRMDLGATEVALGNYRQAEQCLRRALTVFRQGARRIRLVVTLEYLGTLY
ncbi:MAG: tetratricopeptide repeat protein, partial [Akkermansiaceae bacterium]|nr:tetratricopeptide repeat protein [Akkermansiaceae bacterium]